MTEPTATPLVSVIIPVYNGATTLPHVLDGLAKQTLPADRYEVIVADDGSSDDTPTILSQWAEHSPFSLKVLCQPENRGASAARNLAAHHAQGEYLVFIDADCVPDEHLLELHAATLRLHSPHTGAIGRIIWSAEFGGGPMAEYYKKLYFPDQQSLTPAALEDVPYTFFVTSNAAMPRRCFEELGGFDEDFRYLWDDTILGLKLKNAGGKLVLNREAVVYHHRPLLPGEALGRFRRQGQEAMRLLKKYPELVGVVADPGEILADPFHQEELYRLLARWGLGLGYAEGAGRYFDTAELDELLEHPEFAANFATWRDQRLSLYRHEAAQLRDDQTKMRAYVRDLEAAYERERQAIADLKSELAHEQAYSRSLEQAQGYTPTGFSFNSSIIKQRLTRLYERGRRAVQGRLPRK